METRVRENRRPEIGLPFPQLQNEKKKKSQDLGLE